MFESSDRAVPSSSDLLAIIGQVRRRWRMKLAVRGAVVVLLTGAVVFFAAAYGLQWARFSGTSIIAARVFLALALAASAGWFLVRPLRRRVTDEQVALYLEEHEPSLQATLVSAVESAHSGRPFESSALVHRLIEQAVERCAQADAVRRVERQPLQRYGAVLGAVAVAAVLFVALGPGFLRSALSAILLVSRDVVREALGRIAAILRSAGDTIQRCHGLEAVAILHEGLDDAEREIERVFGPDEAEADSESPEPDRGS